MKVYWYSEAMKKKTIVMTASLLLLGGTIFGLFVYSTPNTDNKDLSDEEIKAKYCHVTADLRKTDVYCQNPALYRQHTREGKVLTNTQTEFENRQNIKYFKTQEECENQSGKSCHGPLMCDYIPEGKSLEETCGEGFFKGAWAPLDQ